MHRSGTSMVASLCAGLGANLPGDLLRANRWNAYGYFESQAIVQAHDRLLNAFGRAWFDIRPLPSDWVEQSSAHACSYSLEQVLGECLSRPERPIVIKDPRLGQTGALWQDISRRKGLRLSHLIVLRPAHEVAASLMARDHINPRIAVAMWWVMITAVLRQARSQAHAIITYAQALHQPERVGVLLREVLGAAVQVPRTDAPTKPDTSLRHHTAPLPELLNDRLAQRCDELYLRLAQCVTIPPDLDLDTPVPELDELLRGYPEWAWLFQRHHALLERMRGLRDSMSQAID